MSSEPKKEMKQEPLTPGNFGGPRGGRGGSGGRGGFNNQPFNRRSSPTPGGSRGNCLSDYKWPKEFSEAGLLNKCSCLAHTLGVINLQIRDMTLVTLCCVT